MHWKSETRIFTSLQSLASPEKAKILQRFFKTGKGEYGEGDQFLWVVVPDIRKVAKTNKNLPLNDIQLLLHSPRHEMRMCALLILTEQVKSLCWKKKAKEFWAIIDLYLHNTPFINNRDLVDLSAPEIVGQYYFDKDRSKLYELASSSLLRDRRIAVLATFYFIKQGQHADTFTLAELLLHDSHDLIQKAVWRMLREVWKRIDEQLLISFLNLHACEMPRVMLRYAIERLPEATRKYYLAKR